MIKVEVNNIKMVMGVVAAEILSCHVFHLVGELVSVETSLGEEDLHAVGPIVDEKEGSSEIEGVVGCCGEGRVVEINGGTVGEHTLAVSKTCYSCIYSCVIVAVVSKDIG